MTLTLPFAQMARSTNRSMAHRGHRLTPITYCNVTRLTCYLQKYGLENRARQLHKLLESSH